MKSSAGRTMKYRKEIMDTCMKLNLPLTVRSTSIQIFDKTIGKMFQEEKEMRSVVYAIVILASKCEEIHGNIESLVKRLPESDRESIFSYESEMFEALDYNFHFPSLYLRMYGVLAMLQEKGLIMAGKGAIEEKISKDDGDEIFIYNGKECIVPSIDRLWTCSVQNMDKILLLDKESYKEIELVYASLHFPCEIFGSLTFPFNRDNVVELRNVCENPQFSK
ncbi:cyclin-like protein [Encephalitozoon cuniculi]|uniref:Uncharacterized protein n=1 Tax=Encephalitozoon cuniculi TaxID=6035 RepID=M1JLD0_ENCCN|nr:hypothetical protein ECU09_1830 [Encephalitozoon cuniculi]UYI26881.1 cyclin-like protein [Encephalitozoon cuniculi]